MEDIRNDDKILSALAYVFFIPALYLILTDYRKTRFNAFHGAQALFLWLFIFVVFLLIRFTLNLIWSVYYLPILDVLGNLIKLALWIYAFYCGVKALYGEKYEVPYLAPLAKILC